MASLAKAKASIAVAASKLAGNGNVTVPKV